MPTFRFVDFFTAEQLDIVQDELSSLIADPHLGSVSVTYRRCTLTTGGSATYNPATGVITDPYSNTTISMILGAVKEADAKMAGVDLEATDLKALVDKADLAAEPKSGDVVIHSGTTYEVVKCRYQIHTNFIVLYLKIQGGRKTT